MLLAKLARIRPRDREAVSANDGCCLTCETVNAWSDGAFVIASEAKQSSFGARSWIASSLRSSQ
jgi:hypothetical protein